MDLNESSDERAMVLPTFTEPCPNIFFGEAGQAMSPRGLGIQLLDGLARRKQGAKSVKCQKSWLVGIQDQSFDDRHVLVYGGRRR